MVEYICFRDFKGKCLAGDVDIKRGDALKSDGSAIFLNGCAVCLASSYIANKHFAINEDGDGLRRGALTYAIAYTDRDAGNGFRFSDDEQKMLVNEYSRFLKDADTILFNNDFFTAKIPVLEEIAEKLNIHIEEE